MNNIKGKFTDIVKNEIRPKVGQVDIGDTKIVKFKRVNEIEQPSNNISIVWTKVFYYLYRGNYYTLSPTSFVNFRGYVASNYLSSQTDGSIRDSGNQQNCNIKYVTMLHPGPNSRIGIFPVRVSPITSISCYQRTLNIDGTWSDWFTVFTSLPNGEGNIQINLQGGTYNEIAVFLYKKDSGGSIIGLTGINSIVESWQLYTSFPPHCPIWDTIPITTELLDPVTGASKNILHWYNISDNVIGNGIYRAEDAAIPMAREAPTNDLGDGTLYEASTANGKILANNLMKYTLFATEKTVVDTKTIAANLLNNGDFADLSKTGSEIVSGWVSTSSGTGYSVGVYYDDYYSGGNSIIAIKTNTSKSVNISSTVFALDPTKNIIASYYIKRVSGYTSNPVSDTGPRVEFRFFDSGKNYISCYKNYIIYPYYTGLSSASSWVKKGFRLLDDSITDWPVSTNSPVIPSSACYGQFKIIFFSTAKYTQSIALDSVKVSYQGEGDDSFSRATTDSMFISFSHTAKPTLTFDSYRTKTFIPFDNTLEPVLGYDVTPHVTTDINYREGQIGYGIEIGSGVSNLVTNPSFLVDISSWSSSGTGGNLIHSTADYCLDTGCLNVYRTTSGALCKYAESATIEMEASTATFSFYYKTDTQAKAIISYVTGTPKKTVTLATATSWKRYITTETGLTNNVKFMLGFSSTQSTITNSLFIDNVQAEMSDAPTLYCASTRPQSQYLDVTVTGFTTSRGVISCYVTPTWGMYDCSTDKYIWAVTGDISNYYALRWFGDKQQWYLDVMTSGSSPKSIIINASAFSAHDNLYFAFAWNHTTATFYYNEPTKSSAKAGGGVVLNFLPTGFRIGTGYSNNQPCADSIISDFRHDIKGMTNNDFLLSASANVRLFYPSHSVNRQDYRWIGDRYIMRGEGPILTFEDINVYNHGYYSYVMDAFNEDMMRGGVSTAANITAGDTEAPGPVLNATSNVYTNSIYLSWLNPTDTDFAGVIIYNGGFSTPIGSKSGRPNVNDSLGIINLEYNTTYNLKITTFDRVGNENRSSAVSITANTNIEYQGGNLIPNSDFSNGFAAWIANISTANVTTFSTASYGYGLSSLRIHHSGNSVVGVENNAAIHISPTQTYNFSFMLKIPTSNCAGSGGYRVKSNFYKDLTGTVSCSTASATVHAVNCSGATISAYTQVSKTLGPSGSDIVFPTSCRAITFDIFEYSLGSTGLMYSYTTNLLLEKGNAPNPWRSIHDGVIDGSEIRSGQINVDGNLEKIVIGNSHYQTLITPSTMRFKGSNTNASWDYYTKHVEYCPPQGSSSGVRVTFTRPFYGIGGSTANIIPNIVFFPLNTKTYDASKAGENNQYMSFFATGISWNGFTPVAELRDGSDIKFTSFTVNTSLAAGVSTIRPIGSWTKPAGDLRMHFYIQIDWNCPYEDYWQRVNVKVERKTATPNTWSSTKSVFYKENYSGFLTYAISIPVAATDLRYRVTFTSASANAGGTKIASIKWSTSYYSIGVSGDIFSGGRLGWVAFDGGPFSNQ